LTSLSWDYLSLRLAIGAGPHVYFANLRPIYKFAFFGNNVFAYAFTRKGDDGESHHIAFWDTVKVNKTK
jgi:WD repeat-containing protein 35